MFIAIFMKENVNNLGGGGGEGGKWLLTFTIPK